MRLHQINKRIFQQFIKFVVRIIANRLKGHQHAARDIKVFIREILRRSFRNIFAMVEEIKKLC